MKRRTAEWVQKAEEDAETAKTLAAQAKPPRSVVGFHWQQATEKYFKALLQEIGAAVPRTHDLDGLLDLLLPFDGTLNRLRPGLWGLTRFAVEYRYPGSKTTTRQMLAAVRTGERVRAELRNRLGLAP